MNALVVEVQLIQLHLQLNILGSVHESWRVIVQNCCLVQIVAHLSVDSAEPWWLFFVDAVSRSEPQLRNRLQKFCIQYAEAFRLA